MMQTELTNSNHINKHKNKLIFSESETSAAAAVLAHKNTNEDNISHLDSDTFVSPLQETPDQVSATSSDNE